MAHGSGGRMARDLVEKVLVKPLHNPLLEPLDDSATMPFSGRMAFTTDSYVVRPIFFPGGDIGKLAVCGTVNDLAMVGARPLYISLALILEEGLPLSELQQVVASIRQAADEADVRIVTGDTKVVDHGAADRLFVNTAGVGLVPEGINVSGANARPGDAVILSGSIGDHGIAVLSRREGLSFETELVSDCAPLAGLVADMLAACPAIRAMRDPTRGGLASTLNEIAAKSKVCIRLDERNILVRDAVRGACEMLGFDPLYVANEGKLVAIVPAGDASRVVEVMRRHRYGRDAAVVGEVLDAPAGRVLLKTAVGATRVVDMLTGDLLPRIC
ncbi:MAG: hydrogenase expression/formation protein HypE [Deltaproteobacteria bacterium]|nr:hydrogenase expression/formation protein HypE [Deltaproteobacteria bacterium]